MKESVLSVGWARRDITPPLPVCLCGQFHIRIAEKVLDPLTLTAWAVSNEEDSLLWISCDLLGIPDDFHGRCREILSAKLPGFDPAKLVLSATHTHTAPYLTPMWHNEAFPAGTYPVKDYFELVLNAAVDAAIQMVRKRVPPSGAARRTVRNNKIQPPPGALCRHREEKCLPNCPLRTR